MLKAASEGWPNPPVKVNSTPLCGLSNKSPAERWTSCQMRILPSQVITRINLEKLITTITNIDGSALAEKLITYHQIDYLSPARIATEAVEHMTKSMYLAIRYSITSLV